MCCQRELVTALAARRRADRQLVVVIPGEHIAASITAAQSASATSGLASYLTQHGAAATATALARRSSVTVRSTCCRCTARPAHIGSLGRPSWGVSSCRGGSGPRCVRSSQALGSLVLSSPLW